MPIPSDPQQIAPCSWTDKYIKDAQGTVWTNWDGNPVAFIDLLLQELGNLHNLDRLTIMLRRPNQMKGRVSERPAQPKSMSDASAVLTL